MNSHHFFETKLRLRWHCVSCLNWKHSEKTKKRKNKTKKKPRRTCSENSATSMKSRWNWAPVVQGCPGGTSGTESSSGRVACSSWSSSPKPSEPVKGSKSGEPIIFHPWSDSSQRGRCHLLGPVPLTHRGGPGWGLTLWLSCLLGNTTTTKNSSCRVANFFSSGVTPSGSNPTSCARRRCDNSVFW